MNKKLILNWLSIAILVITTTSTSAVAAAETGGPAAPVLQDGTDTPTPEPTEPPVVVTPGVFPPPENPLIPTETKPSLVFSPVELPPDGVLAYTLPIDTPNWTVPLRAAASPNISISSLGGFTPVGMVEIDSNPETESEPVTYLVMIDLQSTADLVEGQLLALNTLETVDLSFQRIPQELNPDRIDSPFSEFQGLGPGNESVTIYADGVCFMVQIPGAPSSGGGSDDDGDNGSDDDSSTNSSSASSNPTYVRYCSRPTSPDGPDSPLSVIDNFPSQYEYLQDLVREVAGNFDLENRVQFDEIISTIESIQGLQDCVSGSTSDACSSDIVGAPVTDRYFNRQFQRAFGGGGDGDDGDDESQAVSSNTAVIAASAGEDSDDGENGSGGNVTPSLPGTPIEVAVLKVLKPIEIPNGTIEPGDYLVHWWFDSNAVFYAATISGFTTDEVEVTNQQIPAVPATFKDKKREGPNQPASQISGWKLRLFGGREFYVCKIVESC